MFDRWKQKSAIRIEKTYDGVQFTTNYVIKPTKQINKILNHVKSDPNAYCRSQAREDSLTGIPTLSIHNTQDEFVPNEPTIPIVGTLHYSFTTQINNKKKRKIGFIPAFLIFIAALIIVNVIMLSDIAKAERLRATCKVYYKHGEPTHIEFGSIEYNLKNLTEEDFVFMNPWTKEKMDNTKISDCIQIHGE